MKMSTKTLLDSFKTTNLKNFFGNISVTFVDQLSISFIQFFIGIVLIYRSVPEEYGLFSFLMAFYYLIASVQNALINTPLMILSPRLSQKEAYTLSRGIVGLLFIGMLMFMFLTLLGFFFFFRHFENVNLQLVHVFCFLFGLGPLSLRDFLRAEEFAQLRPVHALKRDLVYAFFVIAMIIFMVNFSKINSYNIFILIGVSALSITIIPFVKICKPLPRWKEISFAYQKSWKISAWSVWGATSSWFQMQAFVYLPFFLIGVKEVAYLSAARLVMMPPALLSGSWGNYFRPSASQKMSNGDLAGTLHFFFLSTFALVLVLCLYTCVALLLLRQLPTSWIPESYRNISEYVILWAIIIFFMTIRSTLSYLYQVSLAFKQLAIRGMVSAVFTIASTWYLIIKLGLNGTLKGRIAGEFLLMILLAAGATKVIRAKSDQV